jgi:hypothetical protein
VLSRIPEAPVAGNWPSSFVKLGMDMHATGYTDTRKAGAPVATNLGSFGVRSAAAGANPTLRLGGNYRR